MIIYQPLSQTLRQAGERNGVSPDDFTKWKVAMIAKNLPQIGIKNVNRDIEKKYRNDQEQGKERLHRTDGRALHPTQKPEEMHERIIMASSNVEDIVLDPFLGSGTTAVVAKKLEENGLVLRKARNIFLLLRNE